LQLTAYSLQLTSYAFGGFVNFEKLDVWKRASRLCADVYIETKSLKDYGFRDQLTRSALSVPSNIAEGMTRSSDKEKRRFLEIARSSMAEARTQIYIGIEIDYLKREIAKNWVEETKQISAMISGLINSFDNNL
ncbi:four helix bundle protein, partial [Enterovibrio norvegicus]|uniref:four helix bundle protein n=1 Tax=Enterovibrio norvegicus TaxID=188144 RepID=UPI00036BCBF2